MTEQKPPTGNVGGASTGSGGNHVTNDMKTSLKKAPVITEEMLKPLILPNHQKHFNILTLCVSVALGYYMVFEFDYGPKRHVFSWIREFKARKMKQFFHIDPDDRELASVREKARTNSSDSSSSSSSSAVN